MRTAWTEGCESGAQWKVFPAGPVVMVLLSTEFCRQEYWSGLPFPSPGDLSHPGIKSGSPALQASSLLSEPPEAL